MFLVKAVWLAFAFCWLERADARTSGGLLLLKMHFTIKVTCKENRYKYEIYNFSFTSPPSSPNLPNGMTFYPSQWFDSTEYYKGNGKPKQRCENFKDKFVGEIEVLKNLLANEMIKPKEIKKEDW